MLVAFPHFTFIHCILFADILLFISAFWHAWSIFKGEINNYHIDSRFNWLTMLTGLKNIQNSRLSDLLGIAKTGPIGLDLGLEKLNMVQVTARKNPPEIHAACSDYHNSNIDSLFAEPKPLQNLLTSIFNNHRFKGKKIISSMPSSKLKLLFLNYRCTQDQEQSEALLTALRDRIGNDLTDSIIDYIPINPDGNEHAEHIALVALAKKQDVEAYLDLLTSCGLQVVALEIGPVAIKRLISIMSKQDNTQKSLTLNFGAEKSYLTVLWEGNILLDREINFGMNAVLKSASEGMEINPEAALNILHQYGLSLPDYEVDQFIPDFIDNDIRTTIHEILKPEFLNLAAEIRDVLVYVASETRGGAIEQIYLLGSLARIAGIDQLLRTHLSIPVKTINPFYGFSVRSSNNMVDDLGPLAGIAVATGLALRGITQHA
jgi:type IV pilus assembly protein PilM